MKTKVVQNIQTFIHSWFPAFVWHSDIFFLRKDPTSFCQNIENDPWNMLNNFCFHVYAQKSMFIGENGNAFLAGNQLNEL